MFSSIMRSLPGALELAGVLSPACYHIFGFISTSLIVASTLSPAAIYPATIVSPVFDSNTFGLSYKPTQTWSISTPTAWTPLKRSAASAASFIVLCILAIATGVFMVLGRGALNKPRRCVYVRQASSEGHSSASEHGNNGDSNDQPSGSGSGSGGDPSYPFPATSNNSQRPARRQVGSAGGPPPPPPPPPPGSGLEQDRHDRKPLEEDYHALLILALMGFVFGQIIKLSLKLRSLSNKPRISSTHVSNHILEDESHTLIAYPTPSTEHYNVCDDEDRAMMRALNGFPVARPQCAVAPRAMLKATGAGRRLFYSNDSICLPAYKPLDTCASSLDNAAYELHESMRDEVREIALYIASIATTSVFTYLYYALAKRSGWKPDNVWLWMRVIRSPDAFGETMGLIVRLMLSETGGQPSAQDHSTDTTSGDYSAEEAENAQQDHSEPDTTSSDYNVEEAESAQQDHSEQQMSEDDDLDMYVLLEEGDDLPHKAIELAVTTRAATPQQAACMRTTPEMSPSGSLLSRIWAAAEPEKVQSGERNRKERVARPEDVPYKRTRRGGRRMRRKKIDEQETTEEQATGQETAA